MDRFRILVGLRVRSVTPISETGSIFRPPQGGFLKIFVPETLTDTFFLFKTSPKSTQNPPAAGRSWHNLEKRRSRDEDLR